MKILFTLLAALIALPASAAEQFDSELAARKHCPDDAVVWLNLLNGKVHAKDSKWYGRTRSGAYACRKELADPSKKTAKTQSVAPQSAEPAKTQGWRKIVDDGIRTVHLAAAPLERKGSRVTILALIDLREPAALSDGKQFLSWQTQYEFDCDKKLYRIVAAAMYSGNMGEGEVTGSVVYDTPELPPIPVGSNGELLWKNACGKH